MKLKFITIVIPPHTGRCRREVEPGGWWRRVAGGVVLVARCCNAESKRLWCGRAALAFAVRSNAVSAFFYDWRWSMTCCAI